MKRGGQRIQQDMAQGESKKKKGTCTGLAAISSPASVPPTTRPSGLAKEMLMPPVRPTRDPPKSVGVKDPDKERISNRPCKKLAGRRNKVS